MNLMRSFVVLSLLLFAFTLKAQEKAQRCDETLHYGDTLVCRTRFKPHGRIIKEDFYAAGKYLFTRSYKYHKNGDSEWIQQNAKCPFAKANGPALAVYANGVTKASTTFVDGKLHGKDLSWYESGTPMCECNYTRGKRDGVQKTYHENGMLWAETVYQNGRLLKIVQYKDTKGNDQTIGSFSDGNGTLIDYDETDTPILVYYYKNGKITRKKKR